MEPMPVPSPVDALHDLVVAAAREFNAGRYFEAHEALEEALDELPDEHWPLFLGLIQVAVGYHKITQGLRSGAKRMLGLGTEKLAPLPGDAGGLLDLDDLRRRAGADLRALADASFDEAAFVRSPPRMKPGRPRAKG
jgi:hypothetical protein